MTDLKQGPISWEAAGAICDNYAEVLATEYIGHELHVTEHGTIRWVANPEREQELMNKFGAKDLNDLFMKGADKNDHEIRLLYKCMGYSLSGFWGLFYWEVNNEDAYKYQGRNYDASKKRLRLSIVVEIDEFLDDDEFVEDLERHLNENYNTKDVFIVE